MVKTFIMARNYIEAVYKAADLSLGPSGRSWEYLHDPKQLLGYNSVKIIKHGAYYNHPNFSKIEALLKKIEITGKVDVMH